MISKNPGPTGLTALDHHLYRCFTSSDIHTPALTHIAALDPDTNSGTTQHFSSISEKLGRVPGGSGLIIGEWSGALNPGSLTSSTTGGREETRRYIETQIQLYDKTCAGWFFWTFKKQHPGDFGWSLRDAVGARTFPDYVGLRSKRANEVDVDPEVIARAKGELKIAASGAIPYFSSASVGNLIHDDKKIIRNGGLNIPVITSIGALTRATTKAGIVLSYSSNSISTDVTPSPN